MKLLTKLSQWYLKRQCVRANQKKAENQDKTRINIYNNLRQLYQFVAWLNSKGLKNRHQRRAFWAKVKSGEPLLEKTINDLVERYRKDIDEKK